MQAGKVHATSPLQSHGTSRQPLLETFAASYSGIICAFLGGTSDTSMLR